METDGKEMGRSLTALGLKNQIVKAQMIYLTYFDNVQKGEDFLRNTPIVSRKVVMKG